jgi:Protein of unknown function (DUF2946)
MTWFAVAALLGLALLPTVSHALAWAQGGRTVWAEICTAQGPRLVAIDDAAAGQDSPATSAAHLEHCPFCAQASAVAGPPPAPITVPVVPAERTGPPARFFAAPHTLFAWSSAQPRAPPAVS